MRVCIAEFGASNILVFFNDRLMAMELLKNLNQISNFLIHYVFKVLDLIELIIFLAYLPYTDFSLGYPRIYQD